MIVFLFLFYLLFYLKILLVFDIVFWLHDAIGGGLSRLSFGLCYMLCFSPFLCVKSILKGIVARRLWFVKDFCGIFFKTAMPPPANIYTFGKYSVQATGSFG